ncbi:MAG: transposase [Candidatus Omnitrophica bacterium]|nr:transposase [Candidatus Omnitrophota bacterium]
MARPLRMEFPNAVYHVYSRGNERKEIYRSDVDYELFLGILADCAARFDFLVHAYSLMPNHFHLLLETKDSNLSHAMKRLIGLYTVRFNRRHKRYGHLFQGRYKALLVDKDHYFLELSRYVHLNPVRAKMVQKPEDHPWSSMKHYLKEKAPDYLHREFTLESFESKAAYRRFVMEGLEAGRDPVKEAIGGFMIGSEAFLDRLKAKISPKKNKDFAGKKALFRKPPEDVIKHLEGHDKKTAIYAMWKFSRATQRQIGERFNISHSAVSASVRRLEPRLLRDKDLRNRLTKLEQAIQMSKVED